MTSPNPQSAPSSRSTARSGVSADHVVVIGAGVVGVSTAIWLRRAGKRVTLIDRAAPGQGTSYGNGGVLAACAFIPVTTPGLIAKSPRMVFNREFPLFVRWSYLPRMLPWLLEYLSNANDADTRRIARGLAPITTDTVDQHLSLAKGTAAEAFVAQSDYSFAYANRAAFEGDRYVWDLRRAAGFDPVLREGAAVQAFEPALGPSVTCLATLADHGYILDPAGYVAALAEVLVQEGGQVRTAQVEDFDLTGGRISRVMTDQGPIDCDAAVLATGVWSKPLMARLGLKVPLESERGYHIVYKNSSAHPRHPMMVASGKFVATPMAAGLRCAGIVEFGGLDAGPSAAPLALMRRHVRAAFPNLTATAEVEWQGHRPAPADSLPLIGEVGAKGVYAAFGHHHIGLTGGPKTGRLVADLIAGRSPNIDMSAYAPRRFM